MGSTFPQSLDSFLCPSGSTKLNQIPHAELHCSESAGILSVQTQLGVTGSTIPTTVEYRLHNTSSGHDHDGVNSRPVAVGPDCNNLSGSGSFANGFFTDLSGTTRVGCAIDKINKKLLDLDISGSASVGVALESQDTELTATAVRINLSGSGVSGTLVAPGSVKYTIPGIDYRQITFLAPCGPFEGFIPGAFHEFVHTSKILISSSTWYTDSSKTSKIFETIYTNRNGRKQAEKIIYNVYEPDGVSIKTQAVDIVTFGGVLEISRSRSIS